MSLYFCDNVILLYIYNLPLVVLLIPPFPVRVNKTLHQ